MLSMKLQHFTCVRSSMQGAFSSKHEMGFKKYGAIECSNYL